MERFREKSVCTANTIILKKPMIACLHTSTVNLNELIQITTSNFFAKYVAEITSGESTIMYTDFITEVGVIVRSLNQVGIESVGYHGEMDRLESYMKWKSGEVQIIVDTKAFGMGINKANNYMTCAPYWSSRKH